MPITDTSQPIKEEIEFGIDTYTMYTVTATVFTDFGNISSNATFGKSFSLAHSIIIIYKIASIILVRDVQTGAASTASTSGISTIIIITTRSVLK